MELLLGLTALAAAIALLVRTIHGRRAKRGAPGGSAESAIAIAHFDEIDATIGSRRCQCRGRLIVRGEGPVAGDGALWKARLECRECGREDLIYFDMGSLDHPLSRS